MRDPFSVVKVPEGIPLEVACLVPCSGITAYSALQQSKDSIDTEIQISGNSKTFFKCPKWGFMSPCKANAISGQDLTLNKYPRGLSRVTVLYVLQKTPA